VLVGGDVEGGSALALPLGAVPVKYTVRKGRRYRAHIHLGWLEQVVSDATLIDKFVDAGFTNVSVVGEGRERWCFGTWPNEDASAELPAQIVGVAEV